MPLVVVNDVDTGFQIAKKIASAVPMSDNDSLSFGAVSLCESPEAINEFCNSYIEREKAFNG